MVRRTIQEKKEAKIWIIPLVLMVYAIPLFSNDYIIYNLNIIGIAIVGAIGIDLLAGCAGQLSMGHAAFLAIGAYSYGLLAQNFQMGLMAALVLSGCITAAVGLVLGIPSLRLKGLYLALATMGFVFITEEVIKYMDWLTRGVRGLAVPPARIFGVALDSDFRVYFLIMTIVMVMTMIGRLMLDSKLGRAFIAIRDSDVAAETCGINLTVYKTLAFGISSFYAGLTGALYALTVGLISPENFGIMVSIQYLVMIVVGGAGYIYGAILGAIFIGLLPEAIRFTQYFLPESMALSGYFQMIIYGFTMLIFIVFEPRGLYGRWRVIKNYWKVFPFNSAEVKRVAWIRRWK
jgi:branched-chain amino acid transport system permease protein